MLSNNQSPISNNQANLKSQFPITKRSVFGGLVIGFWLLLGACILVIGVLPVSAQPISSTDLINKAKEYDGKTVIYGGEAIGDIMRRGEYSWVNVNDGENAIGIWAENSLLKDVSYTGTYKSRGDLLEITGIFHRACPGHGGDLDIHAQEIRKIKAGSGIVHKLTIDKRNLAVALLGILGITWTLTRLIKQ